MENTTKDSKTLLLNNLKSSWLENIFNLCLITPIGISIRKIGLFKYLIILSFVNLIIAFSQIFYFYRTPNIFFDLAISINFRIYNVIILNCSQNAHWYYDTTIEIFF
jgi:hypothetical protein